MDHSWILQVINKNPFLVQSVKFKNGVIHMHIIWSTYNFFLDYAENKVFQKEKKNLLSREI